MKEQILDEFETDESNDNDKIYFYKPQLIKRIKSMMLDTVLIIFLMFLMSLILGVLNIESGLVRGICLGLVVLYEPILVTFGGTIGHRIMGLRVRSFSSYSTDKSENSINFFYSLIRFATKILLGWISLLTIHSDDYGQAMHDKVGNSIMTFK